MVSACDFEWQRRCKEKRRVGDGGWKIGAGVAIDDGDSDEWDGQ